VKLFNDLGKRVLIFGGMMILILLVMDFNSRMAELTRLRAQHERESEVIEGLRATEVYLETQIAFATSDAAVEAWAREDGRWARPGDYPVVPVPEGEGALAERAAEEEPAEALSNWQAWMAWFFNLSP